MGLHSGKFGVVNGQSTVRNWSISDTMNNPKFVASNTQGGTGRRRGIRSWSGSYNQYGVYPVALPGQIVSFGGYTAPDNDVSGNGKRYSGNIIIDSIAATWNWGSGDILSLVTNFSGHLALSSSTGSYSDATDPTTPEVCGTKLEYSTDGSTWDELTNLTQAVLTITSANQAYVNSSTNCETGRKPGPLDFTLALTRQECDTEADFAKGDDLQIRIYDTDSTFWLLKWAKVKEFTGLTVDTETGAIIQHTVNLEMNGFVDGDVGQIVLPDDSVLWPNP